MNLLFALAFSTAWASYGHNAPEYITLASTIPHTRCWADRDHHRMDARCMMRSKKVTVRWIRYCAQYRFELPVECGSGPSLADLKSK